MVQYAECCSSHFATVGNNKREETSLLESIMAADYLADLPPRHGRKDIRWCVSGCCTFVCLVPAPTPGSRTVLATTRGREQFAIRLSSGWWCTMLRGLPCLLPTGVGCCGKHGFLFAALILSRRTCSRQMVESGQLIQCKEERYEQ